MRQYLNKAIILTAAISLIVGGFIGVFVTKVNYKLEQLTVGIMSDERMESRGHSGMATKIDHMTTDMQLLTGNEFDRAFLEEMILHHQGALEMSAMAEKNAKRQEIKDLAKSIITSQTAEIQQMRNWISIWYK